MDFPGVCGNMRVRQYLAGEIRRGDVSHAYMLEGAPGSGSRELAVSFAAALVCEGGGEELPCGSCPQCRRALLGNHPDIKLISRTTRLSVGVDTVRMLRADAAVIPSEAEYKIYIIEDADKMTVQAQNAFLLSLEEPPSYVVWLLLAAEAAALLDTVRSRVPVLRLAPVKRRELEEYLIASDDGRARALRDSSPDMWEELLVCAAGNPGTARSLTDPKLLSARLEEKNQALVLLLSILSGGAEAYTGITAQRRMRRETAEALCADMTSALCDMICAARSENYETAFFKNAAKARAAASQYTARRLSAASEAIMRAGERISANASPQLSLLHAAIGIKNVK